MSKKVKILLFAVVSAFAAIGVVFYIVSSKIDPELIKKAAVDAIEDNLRNVDAKIEGVSYSLGLTVKVNVNGVEIVQKKSKTRLLYLKNAKVEIPIFSILTNGGTVDVKIENPELVYKELAGGTSNWQQALPETKGEKSEGSKKESKDKSSSGEVKLPSFVENSRVDLKVVDLNLKYSPLGKKPSDLLVNKILLKNLNLKKTTAFEIVSKANYGLDAEKSASADFQLVGEIALNNLIEKGAIDTNMLLNVENIKLSWMDLNLPSLKNTIKFKMKEGGAIHADLRTTAGGLMSLEADVNVDEKLENVHATKLQTNVNLGSLSGALGKEFSDVFAGIDFGKSEFKLEGTAKLNLKNNKVNPDLSFGVERPLTIVVADLPVAVSFKGQYVGSDVSVKVKNELMSGVATLDAKTKINPMNLPEKLDSYSPVSAKLLITNLKLEKPFIQKLLYGSGKEEKSKEKEKVAGAGETQTAQPASEISFPPFDLSIEGKHIFIGNQEMNLNGKISGKNKKVNVPSLGVLYGTGKANLNASAVLKTSENISSNFSLNLKNMDMGGLNAFLPPLISEIRGRYEGTVKGAVKKTKTLAYDVDTNVKAVDGELKNLNLSSFLLPLIESVSFLKGKVDEDKLKITDKFDKMSISARANERVVDLKKFNFTGNNSSVVMNAKGKISMLETGDSKVKAELIVKDIAGEVKTYSGVSDIPVLLEGKGFAMLPKVKYTTDKLTERVAKKEINKQKKNIEKQFDKEKKKFQKDLEKKAKDLLKGFKL